MRRNSRKPAKVTSNNFLLVVKTLRTIAVVPPRSPETIPKPHPTCRTPRTTLRSTCVLSQGRKTRTHKWELKCRETRKCKETEKTCGKYKRRCKRKNKHCAPKLRGTGENNGAFQLPFRDILDVVPQRIPDLSENSSNLQGSSSAWMFSRGLGF